MSHPDVIVVGAGAAGLMAGIVAAERGASVRILDSQAKIGAKILVAGGGRCNVTNEYVDATRFHGGSRAFVDRVLRAFDLEATFRFFEAIGVPMKLEESGKFFPVSNSGQTVLGALIDTARSAGAEIVTGQPVSAIEPEDGWRVKTPSGVHFARAVILCTGGLALPKSGSTGDGYGFASRLGHSVVRTSPALSPLMASPAVHATLSGVTLPVRLFLRDSEETLGDYEGSFLFTHHGYSGPAALNLSRHVVRERWERPDARVVLRLVPWVREGEEDVFLERLGRHAGRRSVVNALAEIVPRRVAESVSIAARVPTETPFRALSAEQKQRLRRRLLDLPLPVSEVAGYRKAEATAGGVSLDEIEPATMMSRVAPGLFLAGEVVDVDGWLGGYNFQWAWSSGTVAGRAAARWTRAE